MSEKSNAERDELFDPESDLWHCSTSQYGEGQINNENSGGWGSVVKRKWKRGTWIIPDYKKKVCVVWILFHSRLICCQVLSVGGWRSLGGQRGTLSSLLAGFWRCCFHCQKDFISIQSHIWWYWCCSPVIPTHREPSARHPKLHWHFLHSCKSLIAMASVSFTALLLSYFFSAE